MTEIFSSLSKAFFGQFSSMTFKECCLPCDFLKPNTHFEIFFSIKLLICLQITLSLRLLICAMINALVYSSSSVEGQVFYIPVQLTSDCFNSTGEVDSFKE